MIQPIFLATVYENWEKEQRNLAHIAEIVPQALLNIAQLAPDVGLFLRLAQQTSQHVQVTLVIEAVPTLQSHDS